MAGKKRGNTSTRPNPVPRELLLATGIKAQRTGDVAADLQGLGRVVLDQSVIMCGCADRHVVVGLMQDEMIERVVQLSPMVGDEGEARFDIAAAHRFLDLFHIARRLLTMRGQALA